MNIIEIAMLAMMVVGPVALGIFGLLLLAEWEEEARRMVVDRRQLRYGSQTE